MDSGKILIMRHAEKSADPLDPDLSPPGRERGRQLAGWLPTTFGKPSFLFATAVSKHSRRPIETLEPLSQACGLTIDMSFADQDYGALADLLRKTPIYEGALTVVCWHHGNIPPLAHALGANDGDYPDPWKGSVFDLVLAFDFVAGALQVTPVKEPF